MKEYEIYQSTLDKSREEIKKKQLEAQNNASKITATLISDFENLKNNPKAKENQVLDLLP